MAKLQELTDQIISVAKEQVSKIKKEAEENYRMVMDEAKVQGKNDMEEILASARKEAERITTRAISSSAKDITQAKLSLKMELIEDTISSAYKSVLDADTSVYMSRLAKTLTKKARTDAKDGIILFNKKDKENLSKEITDIIKKSGLNVSDECIDIDGGFVLRYGKIEENCSIEAIFRENRDVLIDYIGKNLF